MNIAISLCSLLLAAAPVAATAAPPAEPAPRESVEARRQRNLEMRERVGQRLRVMRTVELAEALKLSEAQALKLSAEMQKFDDRREPLREKLRDARWTVNDAARGDAAAAKRIDAALAAATEARKQLATVDLEEYRALSKLVPAEQQPQLARFLLQFPHRVQRILHEARHGGRGGAGPDGRPMPGFEFGPRSGPGAPPMPPPGPGPDDPEFDEPLEP